MPRRHKGSKPRNKAQPQFMNPIQRIPERLLDGKTFTFVQYVPIVFTSLAGLSTSVGFNVSPNGYQYQITPAGGTPFGFGEYWGQAMQQFAPLSLLYETYTVSDVSMEATPSYPGVAWTSTPQLTAVQTAESRTVFISPLDLGKQLNASVSLPLAKCARTINFQPYLQQNQPSPYLLTYDQTTGGRQLFGISTSATVTPLLSYYQQYSCIVAQEQCVPVVFKLTAKVHFRGRQNTNFTPTLIQTLLTEHSLDAVHAIQEKKSVEQIDTSSDLSRSQIVSLLGALSRPSVVRP